MDDTSRIHLLQELISDWQSGKISDVATLYAVCIIVRANQPPSQNDIEWAEKVYPELVAVMSLPVTSVIDLADKHKVEQPICDLFLAACLTIHVGVISAADPGVLEAVAQRRVLNEWGLSADWRGYEVLVGVADCRLLGRSGWLIANGDVYTAIAVDCSQAKHRQAMIDNGLLADANRRGLNHERAWLVLR